MGSARNCVNADNTAQMYMKHLANHLQIFSWNLNVAYKPLNATQYKAFRKLFWCSFVCFNCYQSEEACLSIVLCCVVLYWPIGPIGKQNMEGFSQWVYTSKCVFWHIKNVWEYSQNKASFHKRSTPSNCAPPIQTIHTYKRYEIISVSWTSVPSCVSYPKRDLSWQTLKEKSIFAGCFLNIVSCHSNISFHATCEENVCRDCFCLSVFRDL